jgi:hypothetical protein
MRVLCFVGAILFAAQPVKADLFLLYNGTGFPANQEWLSYADDGLINGGTATQSTIPTGVRLQTDAIVRGGYSNHTPLAQLKNAAFPNLNRQLGFELSFTLAITSENHENANRAGFSVLLLGSDSRGIELGFWGNEIWGQTANPLFTHGESVAIDTSQQRSYQLRIVNETYSLMEGANTLLSGSVRDYSASLQIPYTLPNYLFLGDNTTSASANIQLGAVTLQSNLTAVPEPSSLSLVSTCLFIGCIATGRWRKRVQVG